jgi:hypothetical protein
MTTTINHKGFDWTVISTDNASDKPNLRKHWDKCGVVEMVIVTGRPKRAVRTFALYRYTNGSFKEVL